MKKSVYMVRPKRIRGAGDLVHYALQPFVAVVDAVAGTDLKNCGACEKRRETFNRKMPL